VTSVAVLAEADSLWTRLSALSTSAGVIVALGVALWQVRRAAAEKGDREAAQARLVVIEVEYPDPYYRAGQGQYPWLSSVKITNYSEQPVFRPRIKSMDARPKVRWGLDLGLDYDEYSDIEVLRSNVPHHVLFEHHDDGGRAIDPRLDDGSRPSDLGPVAGVIEKWVEVDDVTITFTDAAGLRWERTGNSEPKRVLQSAPDSRERQQ